MIHAEEARQGAFWVVGELDYQTRRQLAWTAGAEAEVIVLDADGTEVMARTVDLKPDEGPFSIQVPETGAIAAGDTPSASASAPRLTRRPS